MYKFATLAVVVLLHALPALAADVEVGAGKAYATIQAGVNAAGAGGTVTVYSGTYDEDVAFSSLNGLHIQAATGNSPRLNSITRNFSVTNSSNVVIQGLTTYSQSEGISLFGQCNDVSIRSMTVLECWDDWLEVEGTSNRTTVENCIVYETGAEALQLEAGTGHILQNNKLYDTYRALLVEDGASDVLFENNICAWGYAQESIRVLGSETTIRGNVIYNSQQQAIRVSDAASDVLIDHNTILQYVPEGEEVVHYDPSGVDGTMECILFHEGATGTVKNNLLVGNEDWACIGVDADTIAAGFVEDYNLVYNSGDDTEDSPTTYEYTAYGANDVVDQNPLLPAVSDEYPGELVDYLAFSDFAPQSGSPAIGAGEGGSWIGAVQIPEPGTFALLIFGGLTALAAVWFRKK